LSDSASSGGIPTARDIDHLALTVPDLKEAVSFFVEYLCADFIYEYGPVSNDGTWMTDAMGVDPKATCKIVMLRLGPRTNLELFEYSAPDQSGTPPRNSDIGGSHIAVYVDDIHAAVEYLRAIPGVMVQLGPNEVSDESVLDGISWCYWLTPWGQQMEVITAPNGMGYERITSKRMAPPSPAWRARRLSL